MQKFTPSFMDNRPGFSQQVRPQFERYRKGRGIAIQLVCDGGDINGQPWLTATVNIPGIKLAEDEVVIKDYSENDGLADLMLEAGYLREDPPPRHVFSGYAFIPVFRLTEEAFFAAKEAVCKFRK